MKLSLFSLFFILSVFNVCFAGKNVYPVKDHGQEEFYVQGGTVLVSEKKHQVAMFPTNEKVCGHKCNFYFTILNRTEQPVNFLVGDLTVRDQFGRLLKVVSKHEQLDKKRSQKNCALFLSALNAGLQSYNAQQAGTVHYQSSTYGSGCSSYNSYNSNGSWTQGSIYGHGSSHTSGTMHIEGLRQQAQRQVAFDAQVRDNAIKTEYDYFEHGYSNYYLDTNTIFPGVAYGANFQIEVPRDIEKDLTHLFFTFDVDGEEHTFCFYCWDKR